MFLGIDLGTSAIKLLLVDQKGEVIAPASHPVPMLDSPAGYSEQDPESWWRALLEAARKLRTSNPGAYASIQAIGLSGQMHGAVLLDKDLKVLRPAILWNDSRSQAECEVLKQTVPDIAEIAGVSPMPGLTAPKMMWLQAYEREVYANIKYILLPKDYLRLRLCGEIATDLSDAAGTLWFDQAQRQWSEKICHASHTDLSWLPPLVEGTGEAGQLTGSAADALNLASSISIAVGGGDSAVGALGIGAINEGDAFLSLGTSGQILVAKESYKPVPQAHLHSFAHCVPNRWYQMAAMLNGASPMGWFAGTMGRDIETLLTLVEAISSDKTPLFLPFLTGERTPHNDPDIRGTFYGLTPAMTELDMMRAVVDGIAYSFCDALAVMREAGSDIDRLAAIGGGARSPFVLQTLADVLRLPIVSYQGGDLGPALGAARLAMIATGYATLQNVARKPSEHRIFEPDSGSIDRHQKRLAQFRLLYQSLAPVAESLSL